MEASNFIRMGENRYECTCPRCHGRRIVDRDFNELRWHCILCGATSTPAQRTTAARDTLPCGHDSMYGDRDEPIETDCVACAGKGILTYTFFEMVQMGHIVPDSEPVIMADARRNPPPPDTHPRPAPPVRVPTSPRPAKQRKPRQKPKTHPPAPPRNTAQQPRFSLKPTPQSQSLQPPPTTSTIDLLAEALCAVLPANQPLTQQTIEILANTLPVPGLEVTSQRKWQIISIILLLEQQGILEHKGRHYLYSGAKPTLPLGIKDLPPTMATTPVKVAQQPSLSPSNIIITLAQKVIAQLKIGRHVSTKKIEMLVSDQGVVQWKLNEYVDAVIRYLLINRLIDKPDKNTVVRLK